MKWTLVSNELEVEGSKEYGTTLIKVMSRLRWLTAKRLEEVAQHVDKLYEEQMNTRGEHEREGKRW